MSNESSSISPVLVTGAAGFIGFHVCLKLLEKGTSVVGFDNINSYYDPKLKHARLKILENKSKEFGVGFDFVLGNIEDKASVEECFSEYKPCSVVNLAAQAGVRYSIENPSAYIQSNLVGFGNILEGCRHTKVKHLLYASSSSVYGGNTKLPFAEIQSVDHPVSLYAASKKANELMAHSYSHLYDIPTTGLRFFTVYGPWGRPDMALFLFTKAILEGNPIKIFNNGDMIRDFTYIDDIVKGILCLLEKPASSNSEFDTNTPDPSSSWCPYRIFNIGNSNPIPLMDYIKAVEKSLGMEAVKQFMPMQPGDVKATAASTSALESWTGFCPNTTVEDGVHNFVTWYRNYYSV